MPVHVNPFPGRPLASAPKSLRKVKSGDPLIIPAQTFNAFVDAALDYRFRCQQVATGSLQSTSRTDIILVRNASGADRARFDVLGIASPLIDPTDNTEEFESRVVLSGVVPEEQHTGRFVVLLEPIAAGELGRAVITGVCVARVEPSQVDPYVDDDPFADVKVGETGVLLGGASGAAQVLWLQPYDDRTDPAVAWAVVRIGPPAQSVIELARLTGFYAEGTPEVAVAFTGFPIGKIAQANPDPLPDPLIIWPWRYPPATIGRDMQVALPAIPFESYTPGVPAQNAGRSDVPVQWFAHESDPDGGQYRCLFPFIGVCVG